MDYIKGLYKDLDTFKKAYIIHIGLGYKNIIKALILNYIWYSVNEFNNKNLTFEDNVVNSYIKELHSKLMYIYRNNIIDDNFDSFYEQVDMYVLSMLYEINGIVCNINNYDYIGLKCDMFKYSQTLCLHMRIESELDIYVIDILEDTIISILENI